jgi:hypothetical protein
MKRHSRLLNAAVGLALVPLILACDDSLTGPETPRSGPGGGAEPAVFAIEPAGLRIEVGETIQLTAVLGERTLQPTEVIWRSSAPAVAEVADGMLLGVSEGRATVTAKYAGNIAMAGVKVVSEREGEDDGRHIPER